MKTVGLLLLILLLCSVAPVTAQEHFYDNGVFVGLGAQAEILKREKKINYGFSEFCNPTPVCIPLSPPFSGTPIGGVAPSPTFTLGYKFNEANSISLTGDWARFSASNSLFAPSSSGFTAISVDGEQHVSVPPAGGDTSVNIDWNSDVYNAALEYQRRLTSGELGGVLGLLGFRLRYEGQEFKATAVNLGDVLDSYRERLNEFLFGPYGGLKISFKPDKDSKLNFNFKGLVGWYFKSAHLDAKNRYPICGQCPVFKQKDGSNDGTLFAGAGLDIVYAFTKNWYLDASYEFNWINSAAHIFNTDVSAHGIPSRIVGTTMFSHTPGLKLIYKFD
jgi:opacity protein-like surface antigen